MLGKLSETQTKALKRVQKWLLDHPPGARPRARARKLPLSPLGAGGSVLESLLSRFADRARVDRAKAIPDGEIEILDRSNDRIAARVRDYEVVVDFSDRRILHDCPDWARESREKKFCKHVVRVFYALDGEEASNAVRRISDEVDKWEFESVHGRRPISKG
jgi:hypothetical protein